MAAGQEFWIVSAAVKDEGDLATAMKGVGASAFPVADLHAGSFDTLVHLTDDLAKADAAIDSIVHRLERQYAEVEPNARYIVKTGSGDMDAANYIKNWHWDEAKYPKSRSVTDNLKFLTSTTVKLDDEARNKIQQFNDSRTQRSNISKKDAATLVTTDLVDVLVPGAVGKDDFVYTEHLTTVCVILARGTAPDFTKQYEFFADHVVPGSAKHFTALDDKDGNSLWRVVLMKSDVEAFKKSCREKRYTPRDFEYSEAAYAKLLEDRKKLDLLCADQLEKVKSICQLSWSDAMIASMHVKAMRVYVESVLRYGEGGKFAAFSLVPAGAKTRQSLGYIVGSTAVDQELSQAATEDGEEYYPYVSLAFTPLANTSK